MEVGTEHNTTDNGAFQIQGHQVKEPVLYKINQSWLLYCCISKVF